MNNDKFDEKVKTSLKVVDIAWEKDVVVGSGSIYVNAVCALNDKQFVSSTDSTLKLWNVDSSTAVRTFSGHTDWVIAVCALNDKQFVSGSGPNDCTLKLWNVGSSTAVRTFSGHTGGVRAVCALNDKNFVSGSADKTLKLWNVGKEGDGDVTMAVRTFSGHTDWVIAVCMVNDKQFVSGSSDYTLKLWNVDNSTAVRTFSGHNPSPNPNSYPIKRGVRAVCMVNARQFVSGSSDYTLKLWNVDNSTAVRTFSGHTDGVTAVCMLNAEQFVSSSFDKTLKLWHVDSFTSGDSIPVHHICSALDKLDGYHFVSGGTSNTVKLWSFSHKPLEGKVISDLSNKIRSDPVAIIQSFLGTKTGKQVDTKLQTGGKRRNKKSKKLNKRSMKKKFRKTRRKSRKSRK